MRHHVFLVPGFFGFAAFGKMRYFEHVHRHLEGALAERGVTPQLHDVRTLPTASLLERAALLAADVAARAGGDDAPIHLVGHSAGGLDARIFASPNARLPGGLGDDDLAALRRRVRSVLTVATPNRGTPLARSFLGLAGHRLLRVLSAVTLVVLRKGQLPLGAAVQFSGVWLRGDDALRRRETLLDKVYQDVLAELDRGSREEVIDYLAAIDSSDELLGQLTPEGTAMLDATLERAPGARYGCILAQARPPALRSVMRIGLKPSVQAMHLLYAWLHRNVAAGLRAQPLPDTERARLAGAWGGELPPSSANDGIVPTRSQLFGDIVAAGWADHLDVIGHLHAPDHAPPHYDWLPSGSRFSAQAFARTWDRAAGWMLAA